MKILHVTPAYLPAYRYGGPINSVHALNKWLVRGGAEVTVFTTAIDGPENAKVPYGVPVERDGVTVFYFKPGLGRGWFYASGLRRALRARAREFDVVHITSVFLAASTLGARAARAAGKPYVISPRGSLMQAPLEKKSRWLKSAYLSLIERRNLEGADAIHFTTEAELTEYQRLGYRLRRSIVIPNGLDPVSLPPGDFTAFREKFQLPLDRPLVLFLGRLSWKKGFDTLIPAFAQVAKKVPDALLVVAGGDDEGYGPALQKMIAEAGLADRVRLIGPLADRDKAGAYCAASLFVLSSYAENFAITVAEAMHYGVPVVVSEGVGLAPRVRASGSGMVLPKNADAFAKAMTELLKDPAAARAMGARGRALALAEFSCDTMASQFLAAYTDIIRTHRA